MWGHVGRGAVWWRMRARGRVDQGHGAWGCVELSYWGRWAGSVLAVTLAWVGHVDRMRIQWCSDPSGPGRFEDW